jgi:hypothetical protein
MNTERRLKEKLLKSLFKKGPWESEEDLMACILGVFPKMFEDLHDDDLTQCLQYAQDTIHEGEVGKCDNLWDKDDSCQGDAPCLYPPAFEQPFEGQGFLSDEVEAYKEGHTVSGLTFKRMGDVVDCGNVVACGNVVDFSGKEINVNTMGDKPKTIKVLHGVNLATVGEDSVKKDADEEDIPF